MSEPNKIRAPWTDEQVAGLNRYQRSGRFHPFTGERLAGRHADHSECILVATNAGWLRCAECQSIDGEVVQEWAWSFMVNFKEGQQCI